MMNNILLTQLSACLIAADRSHEIEKYFKKYGDKKEYNEFQYYHCLAKAKQGQIKEAIDELKAFLKIVPEHKKAQQLLFELFICNALSNASANNIEEISVYLTNVLGTFSGTEINNKFSEFKNELQMFLVKAGKREEAVKIWEDEIRRTSGNLVLIHSLALIYYWWAVNEEEHYKNKIPIKKAIYKEKVIYKEKTPGTILFAYDGKQIKINKSENETDFLNKLWNKTIAYWTLLISSDDFWIWWVKEKETALSTKVANEDLKELRIRILNDKLESLFHKYNDYYKQLNNDTLGIHISNGPDKADYHKKLDNDSDSFRHEKYLALFTMEKKLARSWKDILQSAKKDLNLQLDKRMKRFEIVRNIQESVELPTCYGSKNDCKKNKDCLWSPNCISDRNQDVYLNYPAGYLFFEDQGSLTDICFIIENLHRKYPNNDNLGKLRISFSPQKYGRLFSLLDKEYIDHEIMEECEKLFVESDTVEASYLYLLLLKDYGKEFFNMGSYDNAFKKWYECNTLLNDEKLKKKIHDRFYDHLIASFKIEFINMIVALSETESKKLVKQNEIEKAISFLEQGEKLTNSSSLKDNMVALYVEQGFQKLKLKKYKDSRDCFNKALETQPGHMGAREGMALAYNNEGAVAANSNTAFNLYKKAYEYNPNDKVIRENLAGSFRKKAIDISNSLTPYSHSIEADVDKIIELLEEGLCVYNPRAGAVLSSKDLFLGKYKPIKSGLEIIPILTGIDQSQLFQAMVQDLKMAYGIRSKLTFRF